MDRKIRIHNSTAEFLIFTHQAKEEGIEVRIQDDTIWLSQKLMAALFDCSTDNISLHLKNIFHDGELEENSVTEFFSVTAADGKNYHTKHYNLDAIIAVGYRVNSKRATAFRRWAANVLRADGSKDYMGLTTWKNAPNGKIIKSDVSIAKNYLTEKEMRRLDRIVSMYLDYAEEQAERHIPMSMEDWAKKLDAFLQFNEYDLLNDIGTVSAQVAKAFAESEFEKYRVVQDKLFQSDFDKYNTENLLDFDCEEK